MASSSPRLLDVAFEGVRVLFGLAASLSPAVLPALLALTKPGDGRPVLVLPGFGAHDFTTDPLRRFLALKNYAPYGWENGFNTGPKQPTIDHIVARLRYLYEKHGRKVSLIGHSLGGIYARELARAYPHYVDRVITLGSPFGMAENPDASLPIVRKLFNVLNPDSVLESDAALVRHLLVPPPVPATSLYTQQDGIVHWNSCINPESAQTENIEIKIAASHCGLVVHPAALAVIADRLAEPLTGWRPFERLAYPLLWLLTGGEPHTRPAVPVFLPDEKERIAASRPQLGLAAPRQTLTRGPVF